MDKKHIEKYLKTNMKSLGLPPFFYQCTEVDPRFREQTIRKLTTTWKRSRRRSIRVSHHSQLGPHES